MNKMFIHLRKVDLRVLIKNLRHENKIAIVKHIKGNSTLDAVSKRSYSENNPEKNMKSREDKWRID